MPTEHLDGLETVPDAIAATLQRFAASTALVDDLGTSTFADLAVAMARILGAPPFAALRPRARVAISLENSALLRIVELAVLHAGHVRVPLSPRLTGHETAAILEAAGIDLVVVGADRADALGAALDPLDHRARITTDRDLAAIATGTGSATLPAPASVTPDDEVVILMSSGTTGAPKGVVHSNRAWLDHVRMSLAAMPPVGPGDIVLAAAPMSHFAGTIALDCAFAGAALTASARSDAEWIVEAASSRRATILPLVPVLLARLARHLDATGIRLPGLRSVPYGGSTIAVDDLALAAGVLPGVLLQHYGLAEALAPVCVLGPSDHDAALAARAVDADTADAVLASCGRPVDGVEVRLRGDEVQVRSRAAMVGYLGAPARTAAVIDDGGWFSTGDVGRLDRGLLTVLGRADDVIDSGGFSVQPAEVERVLRAHPAVLDAWVVGTAHAVWGRAVTAAVTLRAPVDPDTLSGELLADCRERLASYKKPVRIHVLDSLPVTGVGKPDRRELTRLLEAIHDRSE